METPRPSIADLTKGARSRGSSAMEAAMRAGPVSTASVPDSVPAHGAGFRDSAEKWVGKPASKAFSSVVEASKFLKDSLLTNEQLKTNLLMSGTFALLRAGAVWGSGGFGLGATLGWGAGAGAIKGGFQEVHQQYAKQKESLKERIEADRKIGFVDSSDLVKEAELGDKRLLDIWGKFTKLEDKKAVGKAVVRGAAFGALGAAIGYEVKELGIADLIKDKLGDHLDKFGPLRTAAAGVAGALSGGLVGALERIKFAKKGEFWSKKTAYHVMGGALIGLGIGEVGLSLAGVPTDVLERGREAANSARSALTPESNPVVPAVVPTEVSKPAAMVGPDAIASPAPRVDVAGPRPPELPEAPTAVPDSKPSSPAPEITGIGRGQYDATGNPVANIAEASPTPANWINGQRDAFGNLVPKPGAEAVSSPVATATPEKSSWNPRRWLPSWMGGEAQPPAAVADPPPAGAENNEPQQPAAPAPAAPPAPGVPNRIESFDQELVNRNIQFPPELNDAKYATVKDFDALANELKTNKAWTDEGIKLLDNSLRHTTELTVTDPDAYAQQAFGNPDVSSLKGLIEDKVMGEVILEDPNLKEDLINKAISTLDPNNQGDRDIINALSNMRGASINEFDHTNGAHKKLLEQFQKEPEYSKLFNRAYLESKWHTPSASFSNVNPDLFKHGASIKIPDDIKGYARYNHELKAA